MDPRPETEPGTDPSTEPIPKVRDAARRGWSNGQVAVLLVSIAVVGALVFVLTTVAPPHWLTHFGGGSGFSDVGSGQQVTDDQLRWKCQAAANPDTDAHCEAVALLDSIQTLWKGEAGARYKPVPVVFFRGRPQSACQLAGHSGLPFYCHTDRTVYIDLDFYDSLDNRLARGYVLAHEYAHSQQPGTLSGDRSTELQADCEAGAWASHSTLLSTVSGQPLLANVSEEDIAAALAAAGRIDDHDNLPPLEQKAVGDEFNRRIEIVPRKDFSHGTAQDRENALRTGLSAGVLKKCPTTGW